MGTSSRAITSIAARQPGLAVARAVLMRCLPLPVIAWPQAGPGPLPFPAARGLPLGARSASCPSMMRCFEQVGDRHSASGER